MPCRLEDSFRLGGKKITSKCVIPNVARDKFCVSKQGCAAEISDYWLLAQDKGANAVSKVRNVWVLLNHVGMNNGVAHRM